MPLTVLSIAYPYAPVGHEAVGGAEQILGDLDRELVAQGHTSLVVACEGSTAAGELFAVPCPQGPLDQADRAWWRARYQVAINRALASRRVDLVHLHGIDFYEYELPSHIPVLVTLHMPLSWYPEGLWSRLGRNVTLQCVSESQRSSGPTELQQVPVVRNGVTIPQIALPTQRGDYAVVLGRICPEKNQHEALEAGTRAGLAVHLGGQVFPYSDHMRYFDECVKPRLDADTRHRMLGVVPPEHRPDLLARARCLLHPTLAPETSSLVAMEALAAGTPVIAYRSGALPEIVEDGVTGYLVDDVSGMVRALGRVDALRAEDCRAAAEQRFSRDRMVRDYFQLYRQVLRGPEARYA